MAASPLAISLLGGDNNAAAFGIDPNLASANADIQLGQGMQQGGLSTSPASPAQAAARLAQVLAGTYIHSSAISDLGKAYADVPERMAKVLEEKDPKNALIPVLRSSSPAMRMTGVNLFPKAMTMLVEPADVARGAQRMTGVGPNTNPLSSEGDLAADQAKATHQPISPLAAVYGKAQAEAAGSAPYKEGGTAVMQTPDGPKEVPITAQTRANMPQNAPWPIPQALPKVAPPPVVRSSVQTNPPTPSAAIPMPPPKPAAANMSKDQDRVPAQGAIPGTALSGKPLPNPGNQPLIESDAAELKADREKAERSQTTSGTATLIQDLLPRVKTGWSTETKLQAENILKGSGVDPKQISAFNNIDLASGQVLTKQFLALSMGAMREDFGGSREAFGAMQMFKNSYPSIGTDPEAVKLMSNVVKMDNARGNDLANAKTGYLHDSVAGIQSTGQYRGLHGFNEQFQKTNSPALYVHAAEAMSGRMEAWNGIKGQQSGPQQDAITRLIPPGTNYMAPDGKMHIKPGAAQ